MPRLRSPVRGRSSAPRIRCRLPNCRGLDGGPAFGRGLVGGQWRPVVVGRRPLWCCYNPAVMSAPRWKFDDFTGKVEGPNDPATSHFSASRASSLYRECLQNSLDARSDPGRPVEIAVEKVDLPVDSFAGYELAQHFEAAANCRLLDTKEYKDAFESAALNLNGPKIHALKITDSGTTGTRATGDRQWETPWLSLMGTGVSPKPDGSMGKWGIGKNAVPAATQLRTALYATYYREADGSDVRLLGGRTRLTSHEMNGKQYQAEGMLICDIERRSYRLMANGPAAFIPEPGSPFWLRDPGTAVFVPGFNFNRDHRNWLDEVRNQVIVNFFYALLNQHLSVIALGDSDEEQFTIDLETLDRLAVLAVDDNDGDSHEARTIRYISACRKPERSINIPGIGEVRLHIDVPNGPVDYDSRIALVRHPGMLITDDRKQMGIPGLQRLRGRLKTFTAVLVCIPGTDDHVIRSCENPAHNALSIDEITNSTERTKASKALRKLGEWVKENLPHYDLSDATEGLHLTDELIIERPGSTLKQLWVGEPRKSDRPSAARSYESGTRSQIQDDSDEFESYDPDNYPPISDSDSDSNPDSDSDSDSDPDADPNPDSEPKLGPLPGEKDSPIPNQGPGIDLKPIFGRIYDSHKAVDIHRVKVSFQPPPEGSSEKIELQCVSEDSRRTRIRVNAVRQSEVVEIDHEEDKIVAIDGYLILPVRLFGI